MNPASLGATSARPRGPNDDIGLPDRQYTCPRKSGVSYVICPKCRHCFDGPWLRAKRTATFTGAPGPRARIGGSPRTQEEIVCAVPVQCVLIEPGNFQSQICTSEIRYKGERRRHLDAGRTRQALLGAALLEQAAERHSHDRGWVEIRMSADDLFRDRGGDEALGGVFDGDAEALRDFPLARPRLECDDRYRQGRHHRSAGDANGR